LQPDIVNTREAAVLWPLLWVLGSLLAKDPKKSARPVNAKSATAADRRMFGELIRRRRCLVQRFGFRVKAHPTSSLGRFTAAAAHYPARAFAALAESQ
jgi:putative SOS response-associated peptidase YedK